MAEHVVQFVPTVLGQTSAEVDRLDAAIAGRLGTGGYVRSPNRRDGEAMFDWLVAAKDRFAIVSVRQHVCRHDEDSGDCSGLVTVG